MCCDDGWDSDLVALRTGADIVSVERFTGVREQWTNFSLEGLFDGPASGLLARALSAQDRPLNVVAYCSTQGLERQCRASQGRVRTLATPAALKHILDDKIALRRTLPSLGLEAVPGQVVTLGAATYRELGGLYGLPLVVQFPFGAAGHRTFFVQAEEEFTALGRDDPGAQVVVSKYIPGPAPNINVVVLDEAVLLSYPSVQLVGIRECTTWPAAYCGNDYAATRQLGDRIVRAIYHQARVLASWLQRLGFRGLFGIDFVTDGTSVYPVEINPRFQGSTHLLTQLQLMRGEVALSLIHALHFLPNNERALSAIAESALEPEELSGAQIILYNRERARQTVRGTLKPGIYVYGNGGMTYVREGLTLLDCRGDAEFAITCAVPRTGRIIEPGAPLLKIQTRNAALTAGGRSLRRWAARACHFAYRTLDLCPA
jgi:predicted ATP-grasp superfamily ATP-dependent carboligase